MKFWKELEVPQYLGEAESNCLNIVVGYEKRIIAATKKMTKVNNTKYKENILTENKAAHHQQKHLIKVSHQNFHASVKFC